MKRKSTGNWLIPLIIIAIGLIVIAYFIGPGRRKTQKTEESKTLTDILEVENSVRVSGDEIYLNDEKVSLEELKEELKDYRGNVELIDDHGNKDLFQKVKEVTDECST
ncbi:MAG: hypothetical protein Q4P28_03405 [Tissierellia bacterium]|nr:hypothetical protein [Tissierellia bacterium]